MCLSAVATNGLQLGEVADLDALTFNLSRQRAISKRQIALYLNNIQWFI